MKEIWFFFQDRLSFSVPIVAIDIKKLVNKKIHQCGKFVTARYVAHTIATIDRDWETIMILLCL